MRRSVGALGFLILMLPALIVAHSANAATGDLLSTDRTNVNIRSAPSTSSAIVTRIGPGETAIEIETVGEWRRVRLPVQDRVGWVFAPLMNVVTDLQPTPAQPTTPVVSEPAIERTQPLSGEERLLARLDRFDQNLIGNPRRGQDVFVKCGSCHTTVAGIHAEGPSLVGIFGRPPASAPDYRYSGSMETFAREGAVWDEATLDRFIQRPERLVKGTSMPFSGLRNPQDRRDVIAFLEQLSR